MAFIRKKIKSDKVEINYSNIIEGEGDKFTPGELIEIAKINKICISPLDIHELVKSMGIRLFCVPMDNEVSGSLSLSDNKTDWVMRVNALHHPNRQRFTIAHELGHFARHRAQQTNFEDQNFFRNGESNSMEAEANRFAGELLMPDTLFRDCVRQFSGDIEKVAQSFKVSTLAVRVRAKSLGMKGHGLE